MIVSFGDTATEDLYHNRKTKAVRHFPSDILRIVLRKLDMLNIARQLEDLRIPPGNHLEALKDNYKGYHSIRVNNQWRIIFCWQEGTHEVSLIDYH